MKSLILLILLGISFSVTLHSNEYPIKYDIHFKKWSKYYLPTSDWKLLKSQCIVESNLNPIAISPVGARGVCQFMPATFSDVERKLKVVGDPFDPRLNIQFAGYYMMNMQKFWNSNRPDVDRKNLAMASYNAGAGNLHKAQKKCVGSILFSEIMQCLPCITGHHHIETKNYVKRIRKTHYKLKIGY